MYREELKQRDFPELPNKERPDDRGLLTTGEFSAMVAATEQVPIEVLEERYSLFETTKEIALKRLREHITSKSDDPEVQEYYLQRLERMSERVFVDMSAPEGIGGLYNFDDQYVGIPPLIFLYADPDILERVIQHELIHGVLLQPDETVTDGLAVELIGHDVDGMGYPEQVDLYDRYLGHLSGAEAIGLLHPNPAVAVANLMFEMLQNLGGNIEGIDQLREELRNEWHIITKLFPRLIGLAVGEMERSFEDIDVAFDRFWNENENNLKLRFWGSPERMGGLES